MAENIYFTHSFGTFFLCCVCTLNAALSQEVHDSCSFDRHMTHMHRNESSFQASRYHSTKGVYWVWCTLQAHAPELIFIMLLLVLTNTIKLYLSCPTLVQVSDSEHQHLNMLAAFLVLLGVCKPSLQNHIVCSFTLQIIVGHISENFVFASK